jgi:hypothetical protein
MEISYALDHFDGPSRRSSFDVESRYSLSQSNHHEPDIQDDRLPLVDGNGISPSFDERVHAPEYKPSGSNTSRRLYRKFAKLQDLGAQPHERLPDLVDSEFNNEPASKSRNINIIPLGRSPASSVSSHSKRRRLNSNSNNVALIRSISYALPATLAASIWISFCIYLLSTYLSLPRLPSGQLPRIGDRYALWPYISCIGALHDTLFKTASMSTALCIMSAFSIDYYIGATIRSGIQWRRAKTMFGFITSIFLIALSFVTINAKRHPGEPDKHMVSVVVCFQSSHGWDRTLTFESNNHRYLPASTSGRLSPLKSAISSLVSTCGRSTR